MMSTQARHILLISLAVASLVMLGFAILFVFLGQENASELNQANIDKRKKWRTTGYWFIGVFVLLVSVFTFVLLNKPKAPAVYAPPQQYRAPPAYAPPAYAPSYSPGYSPSYASPSYAPAPSYAPRTY